MFNAQPWNSYQDTEAFTVQVYPREYESSE